MCGFGFVGGWLGEGGVGLTVGDLMWECVGVRSCELLSGGESVFGFLV